MGDYISYNEALKNAFTAEEEEPWQDYKFWWNKFLDDLDGNDRNTFFLNSCITDSAIYVGLLAPEIDLDIINQGFNEACRLGNMSTIKILLPNSLDFERALNTSIRHRQEDAANLIITVYTPYDPNLVILSVQNNLPSTMSKLMYIPTNKNVLLEQAVKHSSVDVLELLLASYKLSPNKAFQLATQYQNSKVVDYLGANNFI